MQISAADTVYVARIAARAPLDAVERMPRGPERRRAAYEALRETARESQRAALAALAPLAERGVVRSVTSMHLPNALVIRTGAGAEAALRDALRGVANLAELRRSVPFAVRAPEVPASGRTFDPTDPARLNTWGLTMTRAPEAWRAGFDGRGMTIGIVDSGLDVTHPAITSAYRGTGADGVQRDDYSWFDPIDHARAPFDPRGHGTTVASVAAGAHVGTAPGARVIAARATANGFNDMVATLEALQWMLAPTRVDGADPRPELGPDIINNSWGTSDGSDTLVRESYEGLRAAGIELVTATGNSGPEPGSISAPASFPGYVSVGAFDRAGELADFSSRGPSPLAEPGAAVPLVIGPGSAVPTAKANTNTYVYSSGTSVATPAVSGAIAILLGAVPSATHDQIVGALAATAVDVAAPGLDDASGYGRIDIAAALAYLRAAAGAR